jgi:lysophospholipase L1-like esterase
MERVTGPVSGAVVRTLQTLVLSAVLVMSGAMLLGGGGSAAVAAATPTEYYVAMGDSLGAGTGASVPANDYVNVLYTHELALHPGLQVMNLSCGGATTGSVINGPGCSYTTGTQLGDAEAFLRVHAGQIAFLTIDIGGNDVDGCDGATGINAACVSSGVANVSKNLPVILAGLRAADPGLAIYGMDYYDPFLSSWLTGTTGQSVAQQSESVTVEFNTLLGQIYSGAAASMADPATLFQTTNFALTGTYNGQVVPENVDLICAWTLMCSQNDIHANDTGHAELAQSFEQVIDNAPAVTTQPLSQFVVTGNTATFTAAATGSPTPTVQWQTSVDRGATWINDVGATSPTLTTGPLTAFENNWLIRAVFSNGQGIEPSAPATITVGTPPTILTQPLNQFVVTGHSATFTAAATGSPAPTVQWQTSVDGGTSWITLAGATSPIFTAGPLTAFENNWLVRAVFNNAGGTVASNPATLTISPTP